MRRYRPLPVACFLRLSCRQAIYRTCPWKVRSTDANAFSEETCRKGGGNGRAGEVAFTNFTVPSRGWELNPTLPHNLDHAFSQVAFPRNTYQHTERTKHVRRRNKTFIFIWRDNEAACFLRWRTQNINRLCKKSTTISNSGPPASYIVGTIDRGHDTRHQRFIAAEANTSCPFTEQPCCQ